MFCMSYIHVAILYLVPTIACNMVSVCLHSCIMSLIRGEAREGGREGKHLQASTDQLGPEIYLQLLAVVNIVQEFKLGLMNLKLTAL